MDVKIKLTQTAHIPDETWIESEEHPVQPVATNYAGAVLGVGIKTARRLIREGKAEIADGQRPFDLDDEEDEDDEDLRS